MKERKKCLSMKHRVDKSFQIRGVMVLTHDVLQPRLTTLSHCKPDQSNIAKPASLRGIRSIGLCYKTLQSLFSESSWVR